MLSVKVIRVDRSRFVVFSVIISAKFSDDFTERFTIDDEPSAIIAEANVEHVSEFSKFQRLVAFATLKLCHFASRLKAVFGFLDARRKMKGVAGPAFKMILPMNLGHRCITVFAIHSVDSARMMSESKRRSVENPQMRKCPQANLVNRLGRSLWSYRFCIRAFVKLKPASQNVGINDVFLQHQVSGWSTSSTISESAVGR
jgi:hypothetical protein